MKKVFKRIAVGLVLCLAVVGAFALLKKAPDLNVPQEDRDILRSITGTEMRSSRPNESGMSSILNDSLQGVPQVGSDLGVGSSAPPTSFGLATAAPPYGSPGSEAPAFNAGSESPAFNATSEAPAFLTAAPAFPTPAPQPVAAVQAPLYGTQHQDAPVFQPAPVPVPAAPVTPATPSTLPPTPAPSAEPTIPSPPLSGPTPPETPPISASPPPFWDGPATSVAATPSLVPMEPRGASDVTDANLWVSPQATNVALPAPVPSPMPVVSTPVAPPASPTGLVDPWPLSIVPAADRDTFSSPEVSSLEEALGAPTVSPTVSPTEPHADLAAQAATPEKSFGEKSIFVRPQLRRLPHVEAPNGIAAIITESTPLAKSAPSETLRPEPVVSEQLVSEQLVSDRILPEEYRQTSIRNTMILSSPTRESADAAAKISFAQQTVAAPAASSGSAPEAGPPAFSDPPYLTEAPTLPFVATEALPVERTRQPERTLAVPLQSPTTVPSSTLSRVPTTSEPASETERSEIRPTVRRFVESQRKAAASGDIAGMRNAYVQLSRLYDHPELNDEERTSLMPTLDRLALDVIFSCKNHVLEPVYVVQPGDSIDSIAAKYHLSPALLMKINGLTGARPLKPGSELKVVLGQFDAKLSVRRAELVLILGGLYAGRFPMTVGSEVANVRGEFVVMSKSDSYKGKILTLSNGVQFRGFERGASDELPTDAFCLSPRDAAELFDILTERSVIVLED